MTNMQEALHGNHHRYDGLYQSRKFRYHNVKKRPSRLSHVVKNMPEEPKVMNIEKYVNSTRLLNICFRRANHLPLLDFQKSKPKRKYTKRAKKEE